MKINRHCLLIFLILLTYHSWLLAGNTGKVAGSVIDKQTEQPLIAANVFVKDTYLGGVTNEKGKYFILQVPPGEYTVVVSYIGYHDVTVKNVEVFVDLTTNINFTMVKSTIELPSVEIVAEQPLVHPDITSTRRMTSRKELEALPGMEQTTDIFIRYGGTVVDVAPEILDIPDGGRLQVRDESLKSIHVRGGRGGEILYMVDGMPVTHPLYGGRDVLDLNVVDIEAMELLTGAFNAEYGQAQSGVLNITTRSGSEKLKTGIEYKTDKIEVFGNSYDTQYTSLYMGGPEPFTRWVLPKLNLGIPGQMSFFVTASAKLTNTAFNNHRDRDRFLLYGLELKEKQDNIGNLNAKLDWNITQQFKLTTSYHSSLKQWSKYAWSWKNYPNQTAEYYRNNQNINIKVTHTLSKSTFYNLNLGYLFIDYKASLDRKSPSDYWLFYKDSVAYNYETYYSSFSVGADSVIAPDSIETSIKAVASDPYGFVDDKSFESIWRDDLTSTLTFKGDITSQIHPEHLLKSGVQIQYHDIQYVDIQDGGIKLSNYGDYKLRGGRPFLKPVGPYPEFGQLRWAFRVYPIMGGGYIQDKFEKEGLIINSGLRIDWFMPGSTIMEDDWKMAWEAATGLDAEWSEIRYNISPRFGISFPISIETVMFFSYGHFNQLPELQYYYRDPYTGSFTGNPNLDFEQTILYEFGFTHQFAPEWAIDIKSYTKDISKQVGTTRLKAALGLPVDLYDNKGYARARGLEFELNKRYSGFYSGKLTYTTQWANGYSSSAFEDYKRSLNDFPNPIRERPLSWDVRHQVIMQATLALPPHVNLFGTRLLNGWNATVLSRFSSGNPYTPGTHDPIVAQKTENSETGPFQTTTDLKINKSFKYNKLRLSLYGEIFNLLDQKNVQMSYGFNAWTGKPYKFGDTIQNLNQYYDWYPMHRLMDPNQYSTSRRANVGIRIDW